MENEKNQVKENEYTENEKKTGDPSQKKKFSASSLIMPIIIIIIFLAFAGVVYYEKVVKPSKDLDEKIGYTLDEQIELGAYTGFDYEITQDEWDECVNEEIQSYTEVERAAKETDQVEFNYTGYVDGEKDSNISQKQVELIIGEDTEGIYKMFSDAMIGHKTGETVQLEVDGAEATAVSMDESDYTGKNVTFKLKIRAVSKLEVDKVTDKWVTNWYFDDYGLETKEDFYDWCREYIIEYSVKPELWQQTIDAANMKKYPQELYDAIVEEFEADALYSADEWGMTRDEYIYDFCGYTDETLEEEYLNEVKSELVMWAIVKKENLEASDEEIEEKYEELYEEVGCETVDEMKELYTREEMEELVLLTKAQDYVYDHSNIKESYTIN